MDYEKTLERIQKKFTLFEIYLLMKQLQKEFLDHSKIEAVRSKLTEGQVVEYLVQNDEVLVGKVRKFHNSAVVLQQMQPPYDLVSVPYYIVNIDGKEINLTSLKSELDIGSRVYYICPHGHEHQGTIIRLNQKTATIRSDSGGEIRVSYNYIKHYIQTVS
jgi:hypothetical protein